MTDKYLMGRDSDASDRLELSNRMWTDNIGYLLHPSILETLPANCSIADVGTGTGAWLRDLYPSLSSVTKLDGFDISPAQFKPDLAANIKLHVADAKSPFPAYLHAQYDVVHIRLLVTAMDKDDWETVTRNVMQLLKPGGTLQWEEARFCDVTMVRDRVDSTTSWLDCTEREFMTRYKSRLDYGWSTLPSIFEKVGLRDVCADVVSSDRVPATRMGMTQVLSQGVFEWARAMEAKQAPVWPVGQLEEVERKTKQDIQSGAYTRFDIHIAIGRKAHE